MIVVFRLPPNPLLYDPFQLLLSYTLRFFPTKQPLSNFYLLNHYLCFFILSPYFRRMSRFQTFSASLFPGEVMILSRHSGMSDPEKLDILKRLLHSAGNPEETFEVKPGTDKRKLSYVKTWCIDKLKAVDVDVRLSRLLQWEQQILLDNIASDEEKTFLQTIRKTNASDFNFIKCYEIAHRYRHYLQVRFRKKEVATVVDFLDTFHRDYEKSKQLSDEIHVATRDILILYEKKQELNTRWIGILSDIFFDEGNDGYTRILAWIRLVLIANSSNDYSFLEEHFKLFEAKLLDGTFYSKRIMANFYSQYLLFYANRQDFKKAAYYGRLSIKLKNNDYLYYANNLVAVLLRDKNTAEALDILKSTATIASESTNFHNRLTHISYFIRALTDSGKAEHAESRGFVFYNLFKKEIFNYRWHLFFSVWLRAMAYCGKFAGLLKMYKLYPGIGAEEMRQNKRQGGFPFITFMSHVARYRLNEISLSELKHTAKNLGLQGGMNVPDDVADFIRVVLKKEWSEGI